MRIATQLAIVVVLAAASVGAWYWNEQRTGESAEGSRQFRSGGRPIGVIITKPRIGSVTITVEAVGTALANEAVTITPKVSGIIDRITFKEGSTVKAGQVLAELDATELKANLEEERAMLQQAQRLFDRAQALIR